MGVMRGTGLEEAWVVELRIASWILALCVLAGCDPTLMPYDRNPAGRSVLDGGSRPLQDAGVGPDLRQPDDAGTSPGPGPAPVGGSCEAIGYLGDCQGDMARWCQEGGLMQHDCAAEGKTCGFVSDTVGYYCVARGAPVGPGTPGPTPTPDAGTSPGPSDGDLGPCDGTPGQCEAARLINQYRASHKADAMHPGECGTPLRWNSNLGRMAQEHQDSMGLGVGHSSNGYPENVGDWFTAEDYAGCVDWIASYDPPAEDHCNSDGSYVASHHCNTMFCNHRTVGVGVVNQGGRMAMTMVFGDEAGNPSW